jgi:CubicO group peptidase (beta-lactamase class C family)
MLKERKAILLSLVLIFVQVVFACSTLEPTVISSPTGTETDSLATRIDQYIQDKHSDFSGVILVAQKGKILISQGYGLADRENAIPNTAQTKFEIGSITKSFTAMAIMILEESGLLNVDDSICLYISDCPNAWKPVTVHHLLNHTSGIPSYTKLYEHGKIGTDIDICEEHSADEVVSTFKDLPLKYTPGQHFRYTNSGYFLLGIIIENVSGERYEEFLQQNIFEPLELTETEYGFTQNSENDHALGYIVDQDQLIKAPCSHVSTAYASGGLTSTVGDLYKWDQALYSAQLVSQETLEKIFTSDVRTSGGKTYGYGWEISKRKGHLLIQHGGETTAFTAQLSRYTDDQVTIIVLTNLKLEDRGIQALRIAMGVTDIVFGEE